MFPGVVAAPFAAVKLGPDYGGNNAKSGFNPSGNISGFSLMHESGTGGSPKYGTVSQLPVVGLISNLFANPYSVRSSPDNGTVGYYRSNLANGVTVELAGTDHVGFYQYTFPSDKGQPGIIVDVSQFLTSKAPKNLAQSYSKGSIQTFDDGHYEGSGTYSGGWNLAVDWTVYFCGRFNETPVTTHTFSGNNVTAQSRDSHQLVESTDSIATVFRFQGTSITSRVGFSFISSAKACQFIDKEAPNDVTLSKLVNDSKNRWNQEVFSKITTTEKNTTMLSQLYTSLYGMHILPSNRTGENPNPKWKATDPYYDDFYTLWDLFRCTTPLYLILQPIMYEEMIRSMIGIFKTDGYLPDGRSSNYNGRSQGGSNADNVLADAYVKGVKGQIDWDNGYAAMHKDAEVPPPNNNDPLALDSSTQHGRSALPDWLKFGFITTRYSRSVSRAIEYSANDFALYQVAKGMGKKADSNYYLKRSRNWRNHFDPNATSFGTSGFVVPRTPGNLAFRKQNPMSCDGCYWSDPYYEGKPWEYTVGAHHDIATLVKYDGGANNFSKRLTTLLDPKLDIADLGNEPSFGSPYLYNFINKQALSVQASRYIAKNNYTMGPEGLPGNSDAGAMQSWLLWNMIGLYPLTGQTTFLIHSPWFSDLNIDLGGGKSLSIKSTTGGDDDGNNSNTAIYVQSLKVNGKSWTQNWLTWDDVFAKGGTMEFVLGTEMKQWDTGALPPSPASGGDETGAPFLGHHNRRDRKWVKIAIVVGVACGVLLFCLIAAIWWLFRRRKGSNARMLKDNNNDDDGGDAEKVDKTTDAQMASEEDVDTSQLTDDTSEAHKPTAEYTLIASAEVVHHPPRDVKSAHFTESTTTVAQETEDELSVAAEPAPIDTKI
jgi:predicted alpha-1,2-mannosidase